MGPVIRVLLICPDRERADHLRNWLLPCTVTSVRSLAEGVLALEDFVPAAVFLDWHNPHAYDQLLLPDFTPELTYKAPVVLITDNPLDVELHNVPIPEGAMVLQPTDIAPWLSGPLWWQITQVRGAGQI